MIDLELCECGNSSFYTDRQRGEVICERCGLVICEHLIDNSSTKRFYNEEEKNQRKQTGSPLTNMLPDKCLSSIIKIRDNNLSLKTKQKFYRLRKTQNRMLKKGKEKK